jgi:pyruvate formate lyase activating enzyme
MEADYYQKLRDNKVQCLLCPHECRINPGNFGICKVRENRDGILYTTVYEKACAFRFDPIEKKPLYHFYPGSEILSIGTVGCNLHCKFCQNWEISQCCSKDYPYLKPLTVDEVMDSLDEKEDNIGIAYTYNEPTIYFEYMMALAKRVKEAGMKNVAVTNGFISKHPLDELLDHIDAFNVDLKAFTEDFYRRITGSKLKPVKESILAIRKKGRHLELTNLVITGLNDKEDVFEEMVRWIASELGPGTPLHLSRYFPSYELDAPATPVDTLTSLFDIARKHLHFVYLGNTDISAGRKTFCPSCGHVVIDRRGYQTYKSGLDLAGNCQNCGQHVIDNV